MKKPNITEGIWKIKVIDSRQEIKILSDDGRTLETMSHGVFGGDNAECVITAVNCTYGKNINPEKIQELIIWADEISKKVNTIQRENQLPSWIKDEIGELKYALKNIYFKD